MNEVLPSPGEGADEWIELYHSGADAVDLSGWSVDDGVGGSEPYLVPDGTILQPGAFILFYGLTSGVFLDDTGDEVRLIDPAGAVVDDVVVIPLARDVSYSRDDAGIWHDNWPPSPGAPNVPLLPASLIDGGRPGLSATGAASESWEVKRTGLHLR